PLLCSSLACVAARIWPLRFTSTKTRSIVPCASSLGRACFARSGRGPSSTARCRSSCARMFRARSARSWSFRGTQYYFPPFADFLHSVETGGASRQTTSGAGGFEYLRANPEAGRIFDDAMTAISARWAPAIAAAYDFGRWNTVTDVGGGNGLLLAEILEAQPGLRGVLADEAH